ncbi:MAG: DUF1801 domain-containing protein [Planctomycetes bacterium]|nr:DUF1801 domain-containing protein [Planctomycetota bacterium]
MKPQPVAVDPDAYVRALRGWQRECVAALRRAVRDAAVFEERIQWGHLVYFHAGPAVLIRAEADRVLFGFWRGKRLRELEARLIASGGYEMATWRIARGDAVDAGSASRLARAAAALNGEHGDPREAVKAKQRGARATAKKAAKK